MIALLRAMRSAAAFVTLVTLLGLAAVVQRLLLWPVSFVAPGLACRLSGGLMQRLGALVQGLVTVGGARWGASGCVPSAQPCLVLMNHQSLLDIPVAALTCRPLFPRFVARRRYRPVPLIGMGLRLTGGVFVDPVRDPIGAVQSLRRAGRDTDRAIVVFPEGHRSRDGELGEFETAGLRAVLGGQRMPVYVIVADGAWRCARFTEFVFGMHRVREHGLVRGPFTPPPTGDLRPFITGLREAMASLLQELRSGAE